MADNQKSLFAVMIGDADSGRFTPASLTPAEVQQWLTSNLEVQWLAPGLPQGTTVDLRVDNQLWPDWDVISNIYHTAITNWPRTIAVGPFGNAPSFYITGSHLHQIFPLECWARW